MRPDRDDQQQTEQVDQVRVEEGEGGGGENIGEDNKSSKDYGDEKEDIFSILVWCYVQIIKGIKHAFIHTYLRRHGFCHQPPGMSKSLLVEVIQAFMPICEYLLEDDLGLTNWKTLTLVLGSISHLTHSQNVTCRKNKKKKKKKTALSLTRPCTLWS